MNGNPSSSLLGASLSESRSALAAVLLVSLASPATPATLAQLPDAERIDVQPEVQPDVDTPREWRAANTWVMMVGLLEWESSHIYANMAKRDRADQVLYETLLGLGVPEDQITYLQDDEGTLENIEQEFTRLLAQTKEGDFLITYFTGHGTVDGEGKGYFVNYDAPDVDDWSGLWKVSSLVGQIEAEFAGDTVLLAAGCCYSGTLGDELRALDTDKGYASLASCLGTLESGGLWTFTETLVSGLTGQPYIDADDDGQISLRELKDHSFEEVGVFMQQEISFAATENFPSKLNLVRALPKPAAGTGGYDPGGYYEILVGKRRARKAAWKKAKVCEAADGMVTFSYYPGEFRELKTLRADSQDIRPISRGRHDPEAVLDVFYNRRWHPAHLLGIDEGTGLHRVGFDKRAGWDGLFFYGDLRLRPGQ
jgi:hypothetical protein